MTHYFEKFKSWYQLYPNEFKNKIMVDKIDYIPTITVEEHISNMIINTNNNFIELYNNLNSFAETLNQNAEVEEIKSKIQDNITRLTKINEDIRS